MSDMTLIEGGGRSHQTAFIVDGDAYDRGGKYQERTKRALESFNGPNNGLGGGPSIKVDVYVVRGAVVTRCPNNTVEVPVEQPVTGSLDEATALVAGLGYTQVWPSIPVK